MEAVKVDKKDVFACWNEIPVWFQAGERIDNLDEYSTEFFEEGKRLRYLPERFRCIKEFVDFNKYKGYLVGEIGCGQGYDLRQMAQAGAHVIGGDLSVRNCMVANKHLRTFGLEGRTVNLDGEHIPYADESLDHIYSFGVLHHTPHMYDAFLEVERILKPGGTLTMMLYRKNWSLWRWQCKYLGWVFMKTVKYDFFKNMYRGLGKMFRIKSFLSDELLDNFQKVAREGGHTLDEICAFMTDGPTNPLSQFVSPDDIRKGFPGLKAEKFYNCYLGPVPVVNKILPASLRQLLARAFGGFLFFRLQKPLKPGQQAPQPRQMVTDEEFKAILRDPVEKKPLSSWHEDYVVAANGDRYPILDGTPILRKEARLDSAEIAA